MNDAEKIQKLNEILGPGAAAAVTNPALRRIFVTVPPGDLVAFTARLKAELDCWYISTISGVDKGEDFEILYHYADTNGTINVRTRIPKTDPRLPSICGVIPGAILYEREIQEMFGIVVDNIPDGRPLLTSDDWPAGNYPLRKDWTFDRPAEVIPGGKK